MEREETRLRNGKKERRIYTDDRMFKKGDRGKADEKEDCRKRPLSRKERRDVKEKTEEGSLFRRKRKEG